MLLFLLPEGVTHLGMWECLPAETQQQVLSTALNSGVLAAALSPAGVILTWQRRNRNTAAPGTVRPHHSFLF